MPIHVHFDIAFSGVASCAKDSARNLVVVGTWQVYYDVICLYSLTFNCYLNIGTIFFLTLGCTGRCSHCAALVVLELDCPRLITLCLQVSFEVLLFQISCVLLVLYWLIKSGYSFCKFEQLEIDEGLDSLHKELFKRYLLWLTRLTLCLQDCGIETEMLEHAVLGCTLLETLDVRSCLKVHLFALFEL